MQATKIMEQEGVLKIAFAEEDRVRGIGTLFRSRISWNGIGRNKFIVRKEHLELFKSKNIKYTPVA